MPDIFYKKSQLPEDVAKDENRKAHATQDTYEGYLKKWILPRWRSYRLPDVKSVHVEQWLKSITVHEVACKLDWKESRLYKHIKNAVKTGLIKYERGTRERNVKRLLPRDHSAGFLPHPRVVLKRNPEIGRKVKYVDPFTGEWKTLKR